MQGLSLVAASGGHSSSRCAGLSLLQPLLLRSTSSRRAGSVVVAHGPSCSAACGIFPDQGSNPCPLHWQADSQPLRHQGSPENQLLMVEPLMPQPPPLASATPRNFRCTWKSLSSGIVKLAYRLLFGQQSFLFLMCVWLPAEGAGML